MIRTAVKGTMSDTSLKSTCAKLGAGYKPVCDHSHYNDGGCVVAGNDWHFSYPSHNNQYGIPRAIMRGAYFYSGRHSSTEYTYQNTGTSHRVSNYWDKVSEL
jgi:hypothetical protein